MGWMYQIRKPHAEILVQSSEKYPSQRPSTQFIQSPGLLFKFN